MVGAPGLDGAVGYSSCVGDALSTSWLGCVGASLVVSVEGQTELVDMAWRRLTGRLGWAGPCTGSEWDTLPCTRR